MYFYAAIKSRNAKYFNVYMCSVFVHYVIKNQIAIVYLKSSEHKKYLVYAVSIAFGNIILNPNHAGLFFIKTIAANDVC